MRVAVITRVSLDCLPPSHVSTRRSRAASLSRQSSPMATDVLPGSISTPRFGSASLLWTAHLTCRQLLLSIRNFCDSQPLLPSSPLVSLPPSPASPESGSSFVGARVFGRGVCQSLKLHRFVGRLIRFHSIILISLDVLISSCPSRASPELVLHGPDWTVPDRTGLRDDRRGRSTPRWWSRACSLPYMTHSAGDDVLRGEGAPRSPMRRENGVARCRAA